MRTKNGFDAKDSTRSSFGKDFIRAHYEQRVIPGRDSYDILDWGSRESQIARFHVLIDILVKYKLIQEGQALKYRILDVGCGLSDLCDMLQNLNLNMEYVGVDIVPRIIGEARRRHPRRQLLLADIFQREPFAPNTFGSAFCSGTFNLEMGNNREFVLHALRMMLPLVRDCLVVNFLHIRAREKYRHCHYFDPALIIDAVLPYVKDVELRDDYLENDFTLILWR